MIVRHVDEVMEVSIPGGQGVSRRMLLAKDGMGFSFHETIIYSGTQMRIQYTNHLEAVYCVGGNGEIENISTGEKHKIYDGVIYALNEHDDHYLHGGTEDMRLICVFNPPVKGTEMHDENGSFPLSDYIEVIDEDSE